MFVVVVGRIFHKIVAPTKAAALRCIASLAVYYRRPCPNKHKSVEILHGRVRDEPATPEFLEVAWYVKKLLRCPDTGP